MKGCSDIGLTRNRVGVRLNRYSYVNFYSVVSELIERNYSIPTCNYTYIVDNHLGKPLNGNHKVSLRKH